MREVEEKIKTKKFVLNIRRDIIYISVRIDLMQVCISDLDRWISS